MTHFAGLNIDSPAADIVEVGLCFVVDVFICRGVCSNVEHVAGVDRNGLR